MRRTPWLSAPIVGALTVIATVTCTDLGPSGSAARTAHVRFHPVFAHAATTAVVDTGPEINFITITAAQETDSAVVGSVNQFVNPTLTEWDMNLDLRLEGRETRNIVVAVELFHAVFPDTLTPLWAGIVIVPVTPGKSADAGTVTLYPGALAPVASIEIQPSPADVPLGSPVTLQAIVRDPSENVLTRVVHWSVSDTSIASISASGVINGKKVGQVTVTASAETKSDTAIADVYAPVPSALVLVSGDSQTGVTNLPLPQDFVVALNDQRGHGMPGLVVRWAKVSDTDGHVDPDSSFTDASGLASARLTLGQSLGQYQVNANAAVGPSGPVSFVATAVPPAPAASVTVTPNSKSMIAGDTATFTAVARDSNNAVITGAIITWTSSDTLRARVDTGGHVLARDSGTVHIKATSGSVSDSATVTITLGSATTLTIVTGNGQSAIAGDTLADSLVVMATDDVGNGISGVTIDWSVVTGGGSVSTASNVTGPGGVASVQWRLGAQLGPQVAQASSAGLANSPRQFNATAASAYRTRTWVGGAAGNPNYWNTAANWSPVGVPAALDTAIIPATANNPVMGQNVNVGPLTVGNGATLDNGGYNLAVNGDLLVDGSIVGSGAVEVYGTGANVHGLVSNLIVVGTALANSSISASSIVIVSGDLKLNGQTVTVGGAFQVGGGTLTMTNANDVLDVQGPTSFANTDETGHLTAGTIVARGDFADQCYNSTEFVSTGTKVVMSGSALAAPQRIAMCSDTLASRFYDLQVVSGASVVTGDNPIVVAHTLTIDGTFTVDSTGVVDVMGPSGSLIVNSGGVLSNGGVVKANLPITNNGTVSGNAVVQRP